MRVKYFDADRMEYYPQDIEMDQAPVEGDYIQMHGVMKRVVRRDWNMHPYRTAANNVRLDQLQTSGTLTLWLKDAPPGVKPI